MPTDEPAKKRRDGGKIDPRVGRTGQSEKSPGTVLFFLATIALLIFGGWYLVTGMADNSKLEDCTMSGRKNCVAPVETTH